MYIRKGWKPTPKQDEERYRPDWFVIILGIFTIALSIISIAMSLSALGLI